jgi:hypothetical protein
MLPTKFQFIWLGIFRGEDFLDIDQSEIRIACGGHVCKLLFGSHKLAPNQNVKLFLAVQKFVICSKRFTP